MAETPKIYKGVYVMKFLMAYLVVAIHTTGWSLMGLLDTAVPYFFLASGFFLFRKLGGTREEDLAAIRRWIGKVLKLYLIWTAVYLPFTVIGFLQDGLSLTTALAVFVRNLLLVGENYLSWPLWYLLAMVWAGILIYLLRWLRMPVWGMFLLGLVLYLAAHFLDLEHMPLYAKVFRTTRNGFFLGLMFLTAGGLVWQWSRRNPALLPWGLALLLAGFAGYRYSPLFLLPFALGIFLLSLRLTLPGLSEGSARSLGAMSKTIYLTHMIFAGLAILLTTLAEGWLLWLLSAACATALAGLLAGPLKDSRINRVLFA